MEATHREPYEGETVDQYRIRMLEVTVAELVETQLGLSILRRDLALALLVLLVGLAMISPAVWGLVVAAGGSAVQILRGWTIR